MRRVLRELPGPRGVEHRLRVAGAVAAHADVSDLEDRRIGPRRRVATHGGDQGLLDAGGGFPREPIADALVRTLRRDRGSDRVALAEHVAEPIVADRWTAKRPALEPA